VTPDIYFINLDRVPERADFMTAQCSRVGLVDPVRFSAVDAAEGHDFPRYQPRRWGPYWTLRRSEVAVFESHRALWEKIAAATGAGVIFEDDVLLSDSFKDVIDALATGAASFDLIKLDALSGRVRLGAETQIGSSRVRVITDVLPSAAAYMLTPEGARKLLSRSGQYCDHLDDFITRPFDGFRAYQLLPGIAVQGMFADVGARMDIPASIANSERTGTTQPAPYDKGPVIYRLAKEVRRAGRRLTRKIYRDRALIRAGGLIGEVPLASDLPGYRR